MEGVLDELNEGDTVQLVVRTDVVVQIVCLSAIEVKNAAYRLQITDNVLCRTCVRPEVVGALLLDHRQCAGNLIPVEVKLIYWTFSSTNSIFANLKYAYSIPEINIVQTQKHT